MAKPHSSFRLDSRCYSILESVRDEHLLPSLNAALNFIVQDYRRIREAEFYARLQSNEREKSANQKQSGVTVAPKVDAAKA
jgi:hypothetical protein